jgi:hypothetical protein
LWLSFWFQLRFWFARLPVLLVRTSLLCLLPLDLPLLDFWLAAGRMRPDYPCIRHFGVSYFTSFFSRPFYVLDSLNFSR